MNITLQRFEQTEVFMYGRLYVNGLFHSHTLEDTVRADVSAETCKGKQPGKTAIPEGTYEVTLTFSDRFKKLLPILFNVPCFTAIRIHGGNTEADSEGCILVGAEVIENRNPNNPSSIAGIARCSVVLNDLIRKMQSVERLEKIYIEVKNVVIT